MNIVMNPNQRSLWNRLWPQSRRRKVQASRHLSNVGDTLPSAYAAEMMVLEERALMATFAVVDNGDPGFAANGFTTFNGAGLNNNLAFRYSSDPAATATWTISGLDPGIYAVAATWIVGVDNGNTVPFSINNGSIIQNAIVNQDLAPQNNFTNSGFNFQTISNGILVDASGTLTVSISNMGANGAAIADAVLATQLSTVTGMIADNTSLTNEINLTNNVPVPGAFQGTLGFAAPGAPGLGSWVFTGLTPGTTYEIALTWVAAPTNATNTLVTISDGLGAPVNTTVNQRLAPSGVVDANANFTVVRDFFTITSNQLFIGLSNQGVMDGNIIVDAVRIVQVTPPDANITVSENGLPLMNGTTLDFGTTPFATPVTRTITIQNTGGVNLNLGNITSSDPNFAITPPANPIVAPGGMITFDITLTGANGGVFAGVVTIPSDDPDTMAFLINVTGIVNAPPVTNIVVFDNGVPLASGGTVDFGTTPFNTPLTRTITIQNTGGVNLNLGTITSDNPEFVITPPANPIVAPGGMITFDITLTGVNAGAFGGVVTIPSNDPDTQAFLIGVLGIVDPPPFPNLLGIDARYGTVGDTILFPGDIAPWSTFRALELNFDQDVLIDTNDLTFTNGLGTAIPFTLSYDNVNFTATLNFLSPLVNGNYFLTIDGDDDLTDGNIGVMDAFGNFLGNGLDIAQNFSFLIGDVDGSGIVNLTDYQLANFFAFPGNFSVYADINGDGRINSLDFNIIRGNLGRRL